MSDAALRFERVSKRFGEVAALEEFSLEVERGEFFGLVGVNGAGKTTLIKCLLDFCDSDGGRIEIFGISHRVTTARGGLAFLPERFNPPHFLTGRDFLQYMMRLYRQPYDELRAREMFATLDLDPAALGKAARTYSKGMTQKLGLAACLLSGKDLYVLDEPTSGLDPKARALFKQALRGLKQTRRTVFFSSHALADVAEMCDRMAVLHQGKLRYAGAPAELAARVDGGDLEQAFLACIEP
ncbi:MAG TPA: ABC transporter ATP-binding protein [Burkholderiales bacterium]|jgi:ABC-2 type transport system ATP-binding protein|nr:ABC transporter ATP-binding protein [Burkholderiales bacterium]